MTVALDVVYDTLGLNNNLKITFRHFYPHNDPQGEARTIPSKNGKARVAKYATQARLVNLSTGELIADAWAYCCPKDTPQRAIGREVALGRLFKLLQQRYGK